LFRKIDGHDTLEIFVHETEATDEARMIGAYALSKVTSVQNLRERVYPALFAVLAGFGMTSGATVLLDFRPQESLTIGT
jgi:CobQ-like glutamine amidotransferase family enzyme